MPRPKVHVLVLSLLFACKGDDPGPAAEPARTFWRDVAPIYFERCVECHQDGGIAPFRLDNAEDARAWAEASARAVEDRTMPPWLVTSDGSCGEFRGSRALAEEEVELITAWAEDGAPAGAPREDLKTPPRLGLSEGLDLHTPEFVPEVEGGPLAEFDEYRCFLVDPGLERDAFLTGYEVTPGNQELVHHVLAMPVDLGRVTEAGVTNQEAMAALDAASPGRAGWPCYSGAGEGVEVEQIPVTWAPGIGAVLYPEGTGVRLREGEQVVIQVHYNLHDADAAGASDRTRVRLRLADAVAREGFFVVLDGFIDTLFAETPDSLPPGQERATYSWTMDIGEWFVAELGLERAEVLGVFPHMHERGRRWQARLVDGSEERCVGDVQAWDFGWQLYYFFAEPQELRAGTKLRVDCEFDTRGAEGPVTPGWGTQNEMCLAGLFVVP